MKRHILHIAIVLMTLPGIGQGIAISDASLKQCFIDSLPALINAGDSTLKQADANAFAGIINCPGNGIQNIDILTEFGNATKLRFEGLGPVGDLTAIASMTQLNSIVIWNSQIEELPDLSGLSELNFIEIQNSQLHTFPTLHSSIEVVALEDSKLTSVALTSPFPQMTQLMLNINDLVSVTGLENAPMLEILFLGENDISSIDGLEGCDSLERLQLWNSKLTELEGLDGKPNLQVVNLSYNDFEELPDFGSFAPATLNVAGNKLTFEDLTPMLSWPSFSNSTYTYKDQQKQGLADDVVLDEGDSWTWQLDFDEAETNNVYYWYKDGVLWDSTSVPEITIPTVSEGSEGIYYGEVRNSLLDSLAIDINEKTLTLNPFGDYEAPVIFTPNGDGDYDELIIKFTGTAKIYNEGGQLVKELEVPGYWDGTTDSGSVAEFGYYFVIVDDEHQFPVSLLK